MEEGISEVWENTRAHVSLGKATSKYVQSGSFNTRSACGQDKACGPQLVRGACQVQESRTPVLGLVEPTTKQNVKCYYYQKSSWTLGSSRPGFKSRFCYLSSDETLIGTRSELQLENLEAASDTPARGLLWGSNGRVGRVKREMPGTARLWSRPSRDIARFRGSYCPHRHTDMRPLERVLAMAGLRSPQGSGWHLLLPPSRPSWGT